MRRVGVAVEGPSDRVFWTRVLGRHFAGKQVWFDIRPMNGRERLIREAPEVTDTFYKAGYEAAFFILDADKDRCPPEVLALFDEPFRQQVRALPLESRFAHVCVAFRELESWVLSDESCIRELLSHPSYAYDPSAVIPAKGKLLKLCREHGCASSGLEDREFARLAAGSFEPQRARALSPSFDYFWNRLSARLA